MKSHLEQNKVETAPRLSPPLKIWSACIGKVGIILFLPLLFLMIVIDFATGYLVRDRVYTQLDDLPHREFALVLGTAKYYLSGTPNLYYQHRLEAAKTVFEAQKVRYLLLSGDKTDYYNEPKMMTEDLKKMAIPSRYLQQDYAGFNTLDSILRADKVFHLTPFTVISQQFHCERALFIAQFHNIEAICFVAKYPEQHYRVRIREFFARTSMMIKLLFGLDIVTLESVSQH